MGMWRRIWWLCCLLALAGIGTRPAAAGVFLKPSGEAAAPLRMRSVEADVSIVHHVVETRSLLVFANEAPRRVEADFMMTLPPGAIVTYFAYWFGGEKVVARILEKERAAAIYGHITSRQRDPALVEMVDRNTFRARIFPIEPNADLKVEIRSVQALPADRHGAFYTYPLRDDAGEGAALERIALRVRVASDPMLRAVENSLGLPVRHSPAGYSMALEGINYRPTKDLRVNLAPVAGPPGAGLRAELYAARSGGPDGFFVLTLVPFRDLQHPRVRVTGIGTYDVLPARLGAVKAHGALHVLGRYRGHGPATVEVRDGAWSAQAALTFPATAAPNNPAAPLWAAEKIAALSGSARHRAEVVALSRRHNIPSRFTSWLAVPASEMQNYWRDTLWSKAADVAAQLAAEQEAGRGKGAPARRLRATLNDYARRMGRAPHAILADAYRARVLSLAGPLAAEEIAGRANSAKARDLRRRLDALSRRAGINTRAVLEEQRRDAAWNKASEYARQLTLQWANGQENTPKAARLRAAMDAMARRAGHRPAEILSPYLSFVGHGLARRLARAEHEGRVPPEAVSWQARLTRIERETGAKPGEFLRRERAHYAAPRAEEIADALAEEMLAGRGEGETAHRLEAEWDTLAARAAISRDIRGWALDNRLDEATDAYLARVEEGRAEPGDLDVLRAQWQRAGRKPGALDEDMPDRVDRRLWRLATDLVETRHATMSDPGALEALEQRLLRLAAQTGKPAETHVAAMEQYRAADATLVVRDAIVAERRKDPPDPRRLAELEARLRKTEPMGQTYAVRRIERLAVEVELDKLGRVESPTAAQQARREDLTRRREELRSRMGDPLIQVQAPADALQVVAVMSDNTVKPLAWNSDADRWEARFDIPAWAAEGTYAITIIIVEKDGARRTQTMRYHVDVTPPTGVARAIRPADADTLRLELEADADTARVSALLPWGVEAPLGTSGAPGRFFALVPIPAQWRGRPISVSWVLTDKAHNRATWTVVADPGVGAAS